MQTTQNLIKEIQEIIKKEGLEEISIVPLLNAYSVLCKDNSGIHFNIIISKKELTIIERYKLDYKSLQGQVTRVYRNKI